MNRRKVLTKEIVILTWLQRGIEDFFFAFKAQGSFVRYSPFFNYMGLELICKSYLLGTRAGDYENQPFQNGLVKVDSIARKAFGHNLSDIISEIQRRKLSGGIGKLLSRKFDGFSGADFIKILESAYLECRYPIPDRSYRRFPIQGKKGVFNDPVYSSGLPKFCYAVAIEILGYIRDDFAIEVPQSFLERLRPMTTNRRFLTLFFGDQRRYLTRKK
jgi:hypothetical protein